MLGFMNGIQADGTVRSCVAENGNLVWFDGDLYRFPFLIIPMIKSIDNRLLNSLIRIVEECD